MNKSLILKNTTANFIGKLVNRGVRILLVPIQIKLLGEEAFGLIGFYALMSGLVAILDFGLSLAANREVARIAAVKENSTVEIRDLIRTFELPYWLIGGLAGLGIYFAADFITNMWITAPALPKETILFSITVIAFLFVARWPISLYSGILYGLQRQVDVNRLIVVVEIINGVGSIIVLLIVPDITIFFIWQLALGILEIVGHVWLCWRSVGGKMLPRPRFQARIFGRIWQYALGVNTIYLLSTLFTRSDSLILSKMLPINYLGYYSIAAHVPTLIGLISGSILPATMPLMVASYEREDSSQLSCNYHRQARWLAFLSVGVAFSISAFAYPILRLWTQSEVVADATWLALTLISAVSALEITSNSANQLSLASGNTRPPIIISMIEGLVVLIGTLALVPSFGIVGAAFSWTMARTIRFILYPILIDRLVLHGEAGDWFFSDTLPILMIGSACFGGGWILHRMLLASHNSLVLWIPITMCVGIIYVRLVIAFNLIPEWRSLPLLSQIYIGNSYKSKS